MLLNPKPKALFITHDAGNYGASRSLQQLLKNYHAYDVDLVIRKRINKKSLSDSEIRAKFGEHICNIHWLFLPFDYCCKYRTDFSFQFTLASYVVSLLWQSDRKRLMEIIRQGNYQYIHLNSLVLHPIITQDYPFIIHMRDIFDGSNPRALDNISKARGIIFIDAATKEPFEQSILPSHIILNNPFDMTGVKHYKDIQSPFPDLNPTEQVIFTMIGVLSATKGTDFVIRSFKRLREDNVRLILVGGGEKKYLSYCKKLAEDDPRILFWGEEKDILKIYAISDYILRGEDYQCIGRTIYEGLYAGCQVIVPGEENKKNLMFQYDIFRDAIHFYHPRDETSLLHLFSGLSGKKIFERIYRSNVGEYIVRFQDFIKCCLGN
ncbi:MAG: glycosyltransferase [Proteobacteria bacterium]|nr:glycosyltransferase [Pseudomonadota bacterium]MBU1688680.1 glycosyltransferase [Pseudomonadota bacterium]